MKVGRKGWLGVLVVGVAVLIWVLVNSGIGSAGGHSDHRPANQQTSGTKTKSGQGSKAPQGKQGTDPQTGLPWIDEGDLPAQGRQTLELIDRGGPYPYDKDGSTFGNFEGVLPKQGKGFYAEYTVKTPGEGDRGARRIVTGGKGRQLQYFWTDDHYETFSRIRR